MREVPLPPADLPPLQRSVVACLAAILETEPGDVPAPPRGHPEPWTVWRHWLGTRGLGLVPVSDPVSFGWPGPWIALLGPGPVAAVAFGVPGGVVWDPLATGLDVDAATGGYVVTPADVALWKPISGAASVGGGRVEAIALAPEAQAPMVLVDEAHARAGRGLVGDRYHTGRGTFSSPHARGVDLTLIESEALAAAQLRSGALTAADARRNVVTSGIDLNALVGRRFAVGEVECLGQRLCEPCAHLQRLTRPGVLRALVHRGGLRADVLADGVIRVGDAITPR